MEASIKGFFEKHQLAYLHKTMVVAVSTGLDSMVLLSSLLSWRQKEHFKIIVAHFNHHERAQSKEEQEFIEQFCQQQKITCFIGHLKLRDRGNFQALARKRRYAFFKQVCESTKADYLLLAHHADDNVETIMMRLLRGSNLLGYAGMEAVLPFHNSTLLRPFLEITKQALVDYAKQTAIKFFEDTSNQEDYYTRNRLRHHLLPMLQAEQPQYVEKFKAFSDTLKGAQAVISDQVKRFVREQCTVIENETSFSKTAFLSLSKYLQTEVLFHLFKALDLSKAQITSIIDGLVAPEPNWEMTLKGKLQIRREYEQIRIAPPVLKWEGQVVISRLGTTKINDKYSVNVKPGEEKNLINDQEIWYNSHKLPVLIRSRRPGDKIKLAGGTKKVSDLLIDLKVPKQKRDQILILEKDGEILAVLGVRKSIKLQEMESCDIIMEVKKHG
ncbi:MAG TPA: tRNA lysidine(34) synthetase TilS [Bacilli bacterium]|nr:MAG: tRNA(Ile)-lysidine synthase [Tenericutes bacterium ADurb.BinA124]HNZ50419.1 tRNA lysidine(34) synthetase TilS [Bacilli bacterium]HOH18210.1 tRNA lysidine(34) synthetase TilS [Bacilli bacterium]HPX84005.1 tRNA lysidine(34) synthetase TilS [Bacilli bacterium]HQC74105.1 tRNA lysidine(34) synthetase TilS [Bacilli bacterium]